LATPELTPVSEEDKPVLANLIQLYRYDLAPIRGYELSEHGMFVYRYLDHHFVDHGLEACFIRVHGRRFLAIGSC
jgi:hypothetical protein